MVQSTTRCIAVVKLGDLPMSLRPGFVLSATRREEIDAGRPGGTSASLPAGV